MFVEYSYELREMLNTLNRRELFGYKRTKIINENKDTYMMRLTPMGNIIKLNLRTHLAKKIEFKELLDILNINTEKQKQKMQSMVIRECMLEGIEKERTVHVMRENGDRDEYTVVINKPRIILRNGLDHKYLIGKQKELYFNKKKRKWETKKTDGIHRFVKRRRREDTEKWIRELKDTFPYYYLDHNNTYFMGMSKEVLEKELAKEPLLSNVEIKMSKGGLQ